MDKKLVSYVDSVLDEGYSLKDAGERLKQEGYEDAEIEVALSHASHNHERHTRLFVALAGFAAFIVLGVLIYVFVIVPTMVPVPEEYRAPLINQAVTRGTQLGSAPEQQSLSSTQAPTVSEDDIASVLTLLGAYKLHANPLTGKPPEIEIILTDTQQTFDASVTGNKVNVWLGAAPHPDVTVRLTRDAIAALAGAKTADEFKSTAATLFRERNQRGYTGELHTSTQDMLLKGYLSLYNDNKDAIESAKKTPSGALVTGNAFLDLPLAGSGLAGMFATISIVWGAVLLRMGIASRKKR
jgi:hypothetical protein